MDELLAIREGARRIHELSDVVIEKYEVHRGLLDINRCLARDHYHKRYIHNLAYLVQGIEFNLKAIQERQNEQAKQKGKYLERSWFSRLISLFGILFSAFSITYNTLFINQHLPSISHFSPCILI
jgi:hypothetical protein